MRNDNILVFCCTDTVPDTLDCLDFKRELLFYFLMRVKLVNCVFTFDPLFEIIGLMQKFCAGSCCADRTVVSIVPVSQRKALEQSRKLYNCTMQFMGSISSHQVVVLSRRWLLPAVLGEVVGRVKTHHRMWNCILYLRQQLWHEVRQTAACTFAEKRRNEWQI